MVFEEQITDEELLEAYFECCKHPKIAAAQIRDELGKGSTRRVKERLQEIVKNGKLKGEVQGCTWVFWKEL
jgi:hypothetical protein